MPVRHRFVCGLCSVVGGADSHSARETGMFSRSLSSRFVSVSGRTRSSQTRDCIDSRANKMTTKDAFLRPSIRLRHIGAIEMRFD